MQCGCARVLQLLLEQVYRPLGCALSVQELHQLVDGGEVARGGGRGAWGTLC